jgi:hypothetical protein
MITNSLLDNINYFDNRVLIRVLLECFKTDSKKSNIFNEFEELNNLIKNNVVLAIVDKLSIDQKEKIVNIQNINFDEFIENNINTLPILSDKELEDIYNSHWKSFVFNKINNSYIRKEN